MPRRATRSTSNPGPSAADVVSTVNRPAVKRPAKKATRPAKKSRSTSSQIPVQVVEAAATALTPDLLEQLVTKVADVVTQRLSGSSMGTNPTASVSLPGSSSPHPPDSTAASRPQHLAGSPTYNRFPGGSSCGAVPRSYRRYTLW